MSSFFICRCSYIHTSIFEWIRFISEQQTWQARFIKVCSEVPWLNWLSIANIILYSLCLILILPYSPFTGLGHVMSLWRISYFHMPLLQQVVLFRVYGWLRLIRPHYYYLYINRLRIFDFGSRSVWWKTNSTAPIFLVSRGFSKVLLSHSFVCLVVLWIILYECFLHIWNV